MWGKPLLLLAFSLACATAARGQATVGAMDVRAGVPLRSAASGGAPGILVTLRDVAVTGHAGKLLRFVVVAYKEGTAETPADFTDARAERHASAWGAVELELPCDALRRAFGAGSHRIWVIASIMDISAPAAPVISGSRVVQQVTVDLGDGPATDRHAADRAANEATIRSKRDRGPQYQAVLDLAAAYDLAVVVRDFTIGGKATRTHYAWDTLADADDALLDRYLAVLAREWRSLPVDFVRATGLRAIVFVKNIRYDGLRVGGGFDVDDRFVVCALEPSFSDEEIMHVLYHEYMHVIDNLQCCRHHFDTEAWARLNHPTASYTGEGALDMIRDDVSEAFREHPAPGFLNGYCRADMYQDKADVFAYLLIAPYYRRAAAWFPGDPYLEGKFGFMRRALRALSPAFTDEYFAALHRGR